MAAIPDIGASMHDAARTRENEEPCICDGCPHQDDCVLSPSICEGLASERAADDAIKARKERDL